MYMVIQEPGTLSQTKTPLSSTLLELEEEILCSEMYLPKIGDFE
jgi:hypothetical protein